MKPKRTDSTRPKIFQSPAAAAAAASVTAAYALAKSEKLEFIETDDSNFEGLRENNPVQDFSIEINAIREENKVLESSVAEVKAENSRVREKIDDINGTYAELSKELHSVQGQLVVERSRCSKLEAQIAELQKRLEMSQSIEDEVQQLRRQKSMVDRNMEMAAAQTQGSGGVWRWIAGTTNT